MIKKKSIFIQDTDETAIVHIVKLWPGFGLGQMHRFPGFLPISLVEFHFDLTHCNFGSAFCLQRKEWTWDESKMVVMHDPVYRYVAGDLPARSSQP